MMPALTDRQRRELEYHDAKHAETYHASVKLDYSVVTEPKRRWWNQMWQMYDEVLRADLRGKKVLVIGCGFGDDCCRLAKAGADVYGFDLSPDSIRVAKECAARDGFKMDLQVMPAETLNYPNGFFDAVVARDILHHVEIPIAFAEVLRVCKPGAIAIINEVYSHTLIDRIRNSWFVRDVLYKRLVNMVYGGKKPYITEDERKMTQHDIVALKRSVNVSRTRYFDMAINRVLPSSVTIINVIDYLVLNALRPIAGVLGGRILLTGRLKT